MGKNLPEPTRNEFIEKLRTELKVRDGYRNEGCSNRESSLDHWSDEEVIREYIDSQTEGGGHGYR